MSPAPRLYPGDKKEEGMRRLSLSVLLFLLLALAACGGTESATDEGPATDPGISLDVASDLGTSDLGTATDKGPADEGNTTVDIPVTLPDLGPLDPGTPTDAVVADVPAPCPIVMTGPTCGEAVACAVQCADAAHETACLAQADAAAKDLWTGLKDCLATNACPGLEGEDLSACAREKCSDKIEACGRQTGKVCRDVWKCRKACEADDLACPVRCAMSSTVAQQDLWKTYRDCILGVDCTLTDVLANGWPTETCEGYAQSHYCSIQAQSCFPPQ